MTGKRKTDAPDFIQISIEVPAFGTSETAEILDVPLWRLQKFLDSPSYQLSPDGRTTGRGSRRMFSTEDIYRIEIAKRMIADGFAPKFVGEIVSQLEDYDFRPRYDDEGDEIDPFQMFGLQRTAKGKVEVRFYDNPPAPGQKDAPYYVFDVAKAIADINGRIAEQLRARMNPRRE